MPFTLCLNTSTIKPQLLLDKIHLTAETGYRGVELWINDVYEFIGQGGEVSDVEKRINDLGLIVRSCLYDAYIEHLIPGAVIRRFNSD